MMSLVLVILMVTTAATYALQQTDLNYIGQNLEINIKVDDNTKYDGKKHRFSLNMTNTGSKTIRRDDWSIYFYSFWMIEPGNLPSADGYILPNYKVKFTHINGGLFSMTPTADFPDILPNGIHFIEFYGQWWAVSRSDVPPNWYVTGQNLNPVNIESTATGKRFVVDFSSIPQWKRYRVDQYNPFTAQDRYRRYNVRNFNTHSNRIIPTPKKMEIRSSKYLSISDKTAICTSDVSESCSLLKEKLGIAVSVNENTETNKQKKKIRLWTNSALGKNLGLYHLYTNLDEETITLIGRSPAAVHYAVQSLLSLVAGSPDHKSIPDVTIEDEPRFEHRGMHVDVSRNFRTKTDIIRLMDGMSMYKLNKLHIHLTDDEGWRLEIPGIPELTEIGGKRCHDLNEKTCIIPQLGSGGDSSTSGSGFFMVADFQDILREATKRHIDVIPEIDMPAHSHAAIKAMEERYSQYKISNPTLANQYRLLDPTDTSEYASVQMFKNNAINPCIDSTYAFIKKVVSEIKQMYQGIQPLTFFHYGGDETPADAWVESSACKQLIKSNPEYKTPRQLKEYFVRQIADITNKLGLNLAGWEDGLLGADGVPFPRGSLPNSEVYGNAWQNIWEWGVGRRAYDLANSGYKVVLSHATHFFFDQPQEPNPEETGLYWATRFTDAKKTFYFLPDRLYDNIAVKRSGERITKAEVCGNKNENCPPLQNKDNIIGLQGQSWGETFMTPETFDYMVFPRLLSLAERSWHKASWEDMDSPERDSTAAEDWESFANTVGHKELGRLGKLGIDYRIAPPGAIVENGYLKVESEFPGSSVQYSRDNGVSWHDVPTEWFLKERHTLHLRARSKDRTRFSRTVLFYPEEPLPISDQHLVDYIAESLDVKYDIISNLVNDWHDFTAKITFRNTGTRDLVSGNWELYFYSIRLIQPKEFPYANGFVINDCNMKVYHVGGSLFKLTPVPQFSLQSSDDVVCTITAQYWQAAKTDSMRNWYVAAEGMKSKNIKSTENEDLSFVGPITRPEQYRRYPEDAWSPYTPQERFGINARMTVSGVKIKPIIPSPVEMTLQNNQVAIDSSWVVLRSSTYTKEIQLLADLFGIVIQNNKPSSNYIEITTAVDINVLNNDITHDEGYWIDITKSFISISVKSTSGAFHAYESLRSLSNGGEMLPVGMIKDQPRFQYRGMHVDVGRNFHTKAEIMKIIDAMAMYKLNKLHFHLTEDEGWRLEIPGLPELTEVGSKRCHDLTEDECILPQLGSGSAKGGLGSGFYTVDDYKEILRYANDRHIEVIPEFDMPGHCRAGVKAMEARFRKYLKYGDEAAAGKYLMTDFADTTRYLSVQMFTDNTINVCMDSTAAFIRYVIQSVKAMHKDIQPLQTYHFGGDETAGAWKDSPECRKFLASSGLKDVDELKKYFAHLMSRITDEEGLHLAAWGDGLKEGPTPYDISKFPGKKDITAYNWENVWEWGQGDKAYKLANAGYKVVLGHATHLYFDHPQEPDPEERGFYWATRFTDTRKTFGFVPSNIYHNADKAGNGKPLTNDQICTNNGVCLQLEKPENIIGMQGQVWTETIRTKDQLQEMVFPRLLALAERAWHKSSWEDTANKEERIKETDVEWTSFAKSLVEKELARLEKLGIKYRIPVPGARMTRRKLHVNTALPGLSVQYSVDNKQTWQDVNSKTKILPGRKVFLRTESVDKTRHSRIVSMTTERKPKRKYGNPR